MSIFPKKPILIFAIAILLCGGLFASWPASAAPWQLVPKCGAGGCNVCDAIGVGINITRIMLGTLGSAALLMFVYGGVLMAISRGHSDQVQKGKDALTNAVKGVIIVLASWVVINYGLAMMLGQTDLSDVKLFDNKTNWATLSCDPSNVDPDCKGKPVGFDCRKDPSNNNVTHKCDNNLQCVSI